MKGSFTHEVPWPDPIGSAARSGVIGEMLNIIEPSTEADPSAIVVQFLAGFGNIVGRSPHLAVEADLHYMNMFLLVVGATSKGRKGVSLGWAARMFDRADPAWAACRKQGLSSGEGLIYHVRDGDGDEDGDPGIDDKRLFVVETEFGSTLRVMARDGNVLSPTLRDAWDRGELATLAKNSPTRATGAHISVVGHVTPEELRRLMGHEIASGLGNRFLFAAARRSQMLADPPPVDERELQAIQERVADIVRFAQRQGLLVRGDDFKSLWREKYPELSSGRDNLVGTVLGRAEAQVLRLSGLFALLDSSSVVTREHLVAALDVWNYSTQSANYIFNDTLDDPTATEILSALKDRPDGLSRTEIQALFSRNKSSNDIQSALNKLRESGLVESERVPTGGRPSERWYLSTTKEEESEETIDGWAKE
jgi:DNA-binding transcriptional ArsR family regulator